MKTKDWSQYTILDNEPIVVTEKLMGIRCAYSFSSLGGLMLFEPDVPEVLEVLVHNTWIEQWCKAHPDYKLHGIKLANIVKVWAISIEDHWLDFEEIAKLNREERTLHCCLDYHWVPLLYVGPYSQLVLEELIRASKKGVIISPVKGTWMDETGRVILTASK